VQDITGRKALEERLEHQAFHDSLTGLSNRALLMDRLGHAPARVERYERAVAVLFVDLDNFKLVNDSFGHDISTPSWPSAASPTTSRSGCPPSIPLNASRKRGWSSAMRTRDTPGCSADGGSSITVALPLYPFVGVPRTPPIPPIRPPTEPVDFINEPVDFINEPEIL
jgi:hypothetical protein